MDVLKKVPVNEQDPTVRINNFEEVCLGYTIDEAVAEAARCIQCKNPKCVKGCPVSIDIPGFIKEIVNRDIEEPIGYNKYSALPAICGRVCPQKHSVSRFASAE